MLTVVYQFLSDWFRMAVYLVRKNIRFEAFGFLFTPFIRTEEDEVLQVGNAVLVSATGI